MSFSPGNLANIFANGYDLTSFFSGHDRSGSAVVSKVTTYGKIREVYLAGGVRDAQIEHSGFWDGDETALDDIMRACLGAETGWLYLPVGDGLGNYCSGAVTIATKYTKKSGTEGAVPFTVSGQATGGDDAALVLHAHATRSTSGNGSSIDNSAATTNGGVGFLQVTAATGSGAIKIQDSTDNSTWTDLIAFAAASAVGAQKIEVTGTVKRYLRVTWAPGTSITFIAAFGRR
jgi:hypothetical protein